jgi:hypothetical protein
MAWLYVPALAGSSLASALCSPAIAPSLTSRGKPMRPESWSRAWKKGGWIRRLSGTTSSPSTAAAGVDAWIASLPGSPVSPGALPVKALALRTSGGSGPTFGTVFAKWIPGSSGWKTCRPSLLEGASDSFSETWPSSGSMRNGTCFAQPTSAPPIVGPGCSFWPTTSEADSRSSGRHTMTTGVMHQGTRLTDAMRAWPSPNVGDATRGPDAHAQREGTATLTGVTAATHDKITSLDGKNARSVHAPPSSAEHWPTPSVPNGGRSSSTSNYDAAGNKRQIDLGAAASHWPTPAQRDYRSPNASSYADRGGESKGEQLPNFVAHLWATPRAEDGESCGNHPGAKGGDSLTGPSRKWATPTAMDSEQAGGKGATGTTRGVSLHLQIDDWPTPTATPYGSSQNGINGIGGENERPSANTPSLERMSRSFLPGLLTLNDGDESSPSDQTSPPLWKTPHGFANTDQYGRTGGGGGEFHKQAMQASETWSTPRSNCNIQNKKNLKPPSDGGRSSKPGLQDQVDTMSGSKAKLNPQFVEWLMGLPIGWTGSALAATEWSRWQSRMRFAYWRLVQGCCDFRIEKVRVGGHAVPDAAP